VKNKKVRHTRKILSSNEK